VVAEAGLGDVTGDVTQHRLRLGFSLTSHPFRTLQQQPIACRVYDISCAETRGFNKRECSLLLAPWATVTDRIGLPFLDISRTQGVTTPLNDGTLHPVHL
jgi:hypothetical protein